MLPWTHWSQWLNFLLDQISCGSSCLSAARRSGPHQPPLWHQTSTEKEIEKKEWIYISACAWTRLVWGEESVRMISTWGFCRNVCLWLAQPPQRFNSGSACLVQLPKCTTSFHVLWMLIREVLITRQTSASVKSLHQSVNDILWM